MADYVMLRRSRNVFSAGLHVVLNIALAVFSTTLTVISGNWVFGVLLVLLSKWRVVAVRPRYWWLNLKANIVDFTVGISLALLVYLAGSDTFNVWHVVFTVIYALWLVLIKPKSSPLMTELQSLFAVFFGGFAVSLLTASIDPFFGALISFIIGYGAARHIFMQGEDHDFTLSTFIFGLLFVELSWIFYHWSIVYKIGTFAIPQFPVATTLIFFLFVRGYRSALRHDGKIRLDDIVFPAVFSVSLILIMVFFFSEASFNI